MYFISRIDKEIFKAIAPAIATDEVVFTGKQAQHVQERHPKAYERHFDHLKEIVESPDFLLRDTKHATTTLVEVGW